MRETERDYLSILLVTLMKKKKVKCEYYVYPRALVILISDIIYPNHSNNFSIIMKFTVPRIYFATIIIKRRCFFIVLFVNYNIQFNINDFVDTLLY